MKVAIVIPFRQQPKQDREEHITKLITTLGSILDELVHCEALARWTILVVEQDNDGRGFNRGALLNIGFAVLDQTEAFDQLIFHDADLLPGEQMKIWYAVDVPQGYIVHLTAKGYTKYEGERRKSGTVPGVVAVGWEDFRRSGGFPTDLWGWAAGLEDRLWMDRLGAFGVRYFPCPVGDWMDLDVDVKEPDDQEYAMHDDALWEIPAEDGGNDETKCSEKFAKLGGGLVTLSFEIVGRGHFFEHADRIRVSLAAGLYSNRASTRGSLVAV